MICRRLGGVPTARAPVPARTRAARPWEGSCPDRFAGHGIAGPVRFHEEYRLTQDGTATILTQSIRATPRGPFRLAAGVLARHFSGSSPPTSADSGTW
jgi:hypothetical protein